MSRLIGVFGLLVVTALAAAACHNSGPPGDMGNQGGMGNDPMMYRTHACAQTAQNGSCAAPQAR
ncbi:MAG TPA: hypothetical protein VLV16_00295 [Gemmatimonadales bacterium]|nr:hypothetical protein [Gemmatimonadales bacterium]